MKTGLSTLGRCLVVAVGLTGTMLQPAGAAEPAPTEVARTLVKKYADTIVSVSIVLKVSGTVGDKPMPPRELKHEALATVIAPSGLAVVSLAALDPSELLDGMRINSARGPLKIEITGTEYKEVKLRLADGTELPARVVLKDTDLDLAFIKPVPTDAPLPKFTWLDLSKEARPELLATGYILGRTSRAMQGAPQIRRSDIISLTEKPRLRIVPENSQASCPMFDAKGNIYGLCVRLMASGRPAGAIVIPASDIAEVAKQADAIKPEALPVPAVESEPAEKKAPTPAPPNGT